MAWIGKDVANHDEIHIGWNGNQAGVDKGQDTQPPEAEWCEYGDDPYRGFVKPNHWMKFHLPSFEVYRDANVA